VALRSLPAILGSLSVPLFFSVGRRLVDERAAVIAAALLAVSPLHVYLGQEVRTYTLVCLLGLASTAALLRALEQPRSMARWAAHALCTALAVYAHYFAALLALAQLAYVLFRGKCERGIVSRCVASFTVAAICYAPWLPNLYAQLTIQGNLTRSAGSWHLHAFATPLVFSVGTTLLWKDAVSPLRIAAAVAAAIGFGAPLVAGLLALRGRPQARALLVLWLFLPLAIPIAVSLALSPMYNVRYVAIASLPFLLLVAAGLTELGARVRVACAVAIAVTVVASITSYFEGTFRDDWRSAARHVERLAGPGDLLLFEEDHQETAYAYYATGPQRRLRVLSAVDGAGGTHQLLAADRARASPVDVATELRGRDKVWLVMCGAPRGAVERDLAFLGPEWRRGDVATFRGIEVLPVQRVSPSAQAHLAGKAAASPRR
jgi:4-amino-4-deoxy-L-arabinose transferase-like glycosyltransferase